LLSFTIVCDSFDPPEKYQDQGDFSDMGFTPEIEAEFAAKNRSAPPRTTAISQAK
jgi:hypothetical protein